MEKDHFAKVFGSTKHREDQSFIASNSWLGSKVGYYFGTSSLGTGYYLDGPLRKRKVDDNCNVEQPTRKKVDSHESLNKMDGAALLEAAEAEVGEDVLDFDLDEPGLKLLVLGFEKKINKNQRLRVKFADEPEKFLGSECELDEEIKKMFAVAASPELFPSFVELGAVGSLLGLLTHDNTDVSIAIISLIVELTDIETAEEASSEMGMLVNAILENQGLELLVQNLGRLNELTNAEDAEGVYSTLSVFENLLEFRPSIATNLCTNTGILKFLLKRLKARKFDTNKLYASEVLSILLQHHPEKLGEVGGVDGVDELLQAVAYYRKRDPASEEEEELVENMFDCLSASVRVSDNQGRFRHSQGFELMVRCMKEKNYAGACALKVLDHAVASNPHNCEALVAAGGLKVLFPAFMGKGVVRKKGRKKKHDTEAEGEGESHAISVVASLCLQLQLGGRNGDVLTRVVAKFSEDYCLKMDRLVELYAEYSQKLAAYDTKPVDLEVDSDDEDGDIEELKYDGRLNAGLFSLQMVAVIMATVVIYSSAARKRCKSKLFEKGVSVSEVKQAVISCASRHQRIRDAAATGPKSAEEGEVVERKQDQLVVDLIARLAVSFPLVEDSAAGTNT